MKWEIIEHKEPTPKELEAKEHYWQNLRHYCFTCKKVTTFVRCDNCGKRFCLEHAERETDGSGEVGYYTYPVCYHCC